MPKKGKSIHKNDLSRKRRQKRKTKLYVFVALFVIIVGGATILARLPALQIREIKVSETKRISADVIEEIATEGMEGNYLWIFPKTNFLIYPKKPIREAILAELPAILEVQLGTEIDRNLYIEVRERLSAALWCRSGQECYYLDEGGIVFARAIQTEGLLPYYGLLSGPVLGKRYGMEGLFDELQLLVQKIETLGVRIVRVDIENELGAEFVTREGYAIKFLPYEKDRDAFFSNLELFVNDLKQKNGGALPALEYIDARYGNKIFYKIKNLN